MPSCISCACCAFDLISGSSCHAQHDISIPHEVLANDYPCSHYVEVEYLVSYRREQQLRERNGLMPNHEEVSCLTCRWMAEWDDMHGCYCDHSTSGYRDRNVGSRINAVTARGPHHCTHWEAGNHCAFCAHYHELTDFCTARYRVTTPGERDSSGCPAFVERRPEHGNSSEQRPPEWPCLKCAYGWPAIGNRGQLLEDIRVCHHHGCPACGKTIDPYQWNCEHEFDSLRHFCPHYDVMLDLTQEVDYTTDHPYRI